MGGGRRGVPGTAAALRRRVCGTRRCALRVAWGRRLAGLRESAERAAQTAIVSAGAEVEAVLAKLGVFENELKVAATHLMLADDMGGLDAMEPKLNALHVLLAIARDAPPSPDLLSVLKQFEAVATAGDLEVTALSAAAARIPDGAGPTQKRRVG